MLIFQDLIWQFNIFQKPINIKFFNDVIYLILKFYYTISEVIHLIFLHFHFINSVFPVFYDQFKYVFIFFILNYDAIDQFL
jgi:hypothetical protein